MSSFHLISRPFLKSCQQYNDYPSKLVERVRYGFPQLQLYHERFKNRQEELNLFAPGDKFFVPYWDVSEDGKVEQRNLLSEDELGRWLGDQYQLDPSDSGKGPARVCSIKPDPQARFVFLESASSVAPIETTASALKRVLSYYQVMPYFPDFLYSFGPRNSDERESAGFSSFRTETTLQNVKPALDMPALKRSGRRFQFCATFKGISSVLFDNGHGSKTETWRIRSAVIYHQFDIQYGTQLWIIGDPLQSIHGIVREHIHEQKDHAARFNTPLQSFKTSLEMLLHYSQWATEDWRWRVQFSEEEIHKSTQHYVIINPDRDVRWDRNGMLVIQNLIEHLTDTVTCIESNIAIMNRLQSFYKDLVDNPAWPQNEISEYKWAVREFASQLGEHIYDLSMQLKRANIALQIGKDRKEILIQHLAAQNAAKQEDYTQIMYRQQHKTSLDAVAMKVITVITLVYLPMTFVSTFFSTDVVKYQPEDDSSNSTGMQSETSKERVSVLALERFFTISIPLMLLTFLCAFGWYRWERYKMNKKAGRYEKGFDV
ncbi:hypothetical protein QBC34DRAFT_58067 [Podospora aff. communis PSN243]|uniref:CorA-like transporter domain-containing protein n=1 Tax=Podospora aff. communis PSN243 TaxID=3040156 RepID=A0AAV9GUP9_9PEZI|nr:hypothetical protein QBC34DRAFT_58067 [Podospora aff. communis PSN243]